MALKVENVSERYAKATPRLKILVGGTPGVGKTLFASTFPNPLYADAEGRLLSVRKRNVKAVTVTSTAILDELRAALAQTPEVRAKVLGGPVDTVVLDTVDEIARLIIKERLRAEKKETMAIGDWGYLGDTLRAMLRGFRNLDLNVILNVHLKGDKDEETGRFWEKPSIQGQVGDEIAGYVDESFLMVARLTTDQTTGNRVLARYLQTVPDAGHNWLKDHSGTLPFEFPIDFTTDYERLSKLIFGDQPAPPAASVEQPVVRAPAGVTAPPAGAAEPTSPPAATVSATKPAPSPAPVGAVPAPTPDAAAPAETAAPAEANAPVVCEDCNKVLDPVADDKQITHSRLRYKVPLCRDCYVGRKNTKSTASR